MLNAFFNLVFWGAMTFVAISVLVGLLSLVVPWPEAIGALGATAFLVVYAYFEPPPSDPEF